MFKSIKELWYKHVTVCRERRNYFRPDYWTEIEPNEFRIVKEGLTDVLHRVASGTLHDTKVGICFNAGFMTRSGSDAPNRRRGCRAFLHMCKVFNLTRSVGRHVHVLEYYPFEDVDNFNISYWEGASLEIRIQAMKWILGEIEKNRLDS